MINKIITVGDIRKLIENVEEVPDDMVIAFDMNGCDHPAGIADEASIKSLYEALGYDGLCLADWDIDKDDPDWEAKLDKLEQPYKDEKILFLYSNRIWLMYLSDYKKIGK